MDLELNLSGDAFRGRTPENRVFWWSRPENDCHWSVHWTLSSFWDIRRQGTFPIVVSQRLYNGGYHLIHQYFWWVHVSRQPDPRSLGFFGNRISIFSVPLLRNHEIIRVLLSCMMSRLYCLLLKNLLKFYPELCLSVTNKICSTSESHSVWLWYDAWWEIALAKLVLRTKPSRIS